MSEIKGLEQKCLWILKCVSRNVTSFFLLHIFSSHSLGFSVELFLVSWCIWCFPIMYLDYKKCPHKCGVKRLWNSNRKEQNSPLIQKVLLVTLLVTLMAGILCLAVTQFFRTCCALSTIWEQVRQGYVCSAVFVYDGKLEMCAER